MFDLFRPLVNSLNTIGDRISRTTTMLDTIGDRISRTTTMLDEIRSLLARPEWVPRAAIKIVGSSNGHGPITIGTSASCPIKGNFTFTVQPQRKIDEKAVIYALNCMIIEARIGARLQTEGDFYDNVVTCGDECNIGSVISVTVEPMMVLYRKSREL